MIKYSIVRAVVTTMLGLICAWTVPLGQAAANAAEVKILAAVALASALAWISQTREVHRG